MSLIDVADVANELPNVVIDADSIPTATQVAGYIANIESDVRAVVAGYRAPWPTDAASDAAKFLRQTIIEGVKWLTLRAIYSGARGDATPEELKIAGDEYKRRTGLLKQVVGGIQAVTSDTAGGVSYPRVGRPAGSPNLSATFYDWTLATDQAEAWADTYPIRTRR